MFVCPQCGFELARDAVLCSRCNAVFDNASTWKPVFKPAETVRPWMPNSIPAADRIRAALWCVIGIGYTSYSLYIGRFYVPAKRGGTTLVGFSAYVMSAAVLVGVAHLASLIVDHYDRRNNEDRYKQFAKTTKYWCWGLLITAFVTSCALKP